MSEAITRRKHRGRSRRPCGPGLPRLGTLPASGVAGSMLAEGARQLAQGKRPRIGDLLLTPENARRVADQLARLRGAAMKFGQLLSMDAGDLLPPESRRYPGALARRRQCHADEPVG
jgi:predicted unusual protein kinase regulating ubiquinone biosynthesis (AarF/ABC1/UbiB family)